MKLQKKRQKKKKGKGNDERIEKEGRKRYSLTGRQTCKTSTKEKEKFLFFLRYIKRTESLEEQKADYMCDASICT